MGARRTHRRAATVVEDYADRPQQMPLADPRSLAGAKADADKASRIAQLDRLLFVESRLSMGREINKGGEIL